MNFFSSGISGIINGTQLETEIGHEKCRILLTAFSCLAITYFDCFEQYQLSSACLGLKNNPDMDSREEKGGETSKSKKRWEILEKVLMYFEVLGIKKTEAGRQI